MNSTMMRSLASPDIWRPLLLRCSCTS